MKILYVDDMVWGHHIPYLKALTDNHDYESAVLIPVKVQEVTVKQIIHEKLSFDSKRVLDYLECMRLIESEAQKENADIIHFLNGDKIMRYFGLGMERLSRKWKVVITFHHFFTGLLRKWSYQQMSHNRAVVVHTNCFYLKMKQYKIYKVFHIEYPSFLRKVEKTSDAFEAPVIGIYGGTRYEKGLDILLKALKNVKADFNLVIAGPKTDFGKDEIEELSVSYKDKVLVDMRFLSETELENYWSRTDLVVLPYRKGFNGASGQLTEGVNHGLPIIGPEHGSLGDIIQKNHLGKVYKSEDVNDLARTIDEVLREGFVYDEVAKAYQRNLSPKRFCEEYYNLYEEMIGRKK